MVNYSGSNVIGQMEYTMCQLSPCTAYAAAKQFGVHPSGGPMYLCLNCLREVQLMLKEIQDARDSANAQSSQ